MYSVWTKDIQDQESKERFLNSIQSAKPVLDRTLEILNEEKNGLDYSEVDVKTFDLPNWEYKQSYKNGYRAALMFVMRLIDLDKQKGAKE